MQPVRMQRLPPERYMQSRMPDMRSQLSGAAVPERRKVLMNPFHAWLWRSQKAGHSLDTLAEWTGLSRYAINRRIMSHRYDSGEVMMTKDDLVEAYTVEMKSIHQIAEQYLCSDESVRWHLIRYGIPRRPRGNPKIKKCGGESDDKRVSET